MKTVGYVGFDTSNYTTSASLCDESGRVLANVRIPLPVKEGERGLRQSDAVFSHVKNLPLACQALKEFAGDVNVAAVGCSVKPRPTEDSYMPCFLLGKVAAEAYAAALGVPLYTFSHQEGHIMAAMYSSGGMGSLLTAPFGAFHVSGGTTEMVLATPTEEGFSVEMLGESADLHAGQAIDRIGVMMGLRFPCGKELEALAAQNTKKIPSSKISVTDGVCHLSGLENMAKKLWEETKDAPFVSAFALDFCARTLVKMTAWFDTEHSDLPIVYGGGVMSNRYLQKVLSKRAKTYFAEPQFSADNAAGIALLTRRKAMKEKGE